MASNSKEEFLGKLTAFHEQRGTRLETEPRVGARTVNLLDLYNTIIARGGYDKVSEEKLAWRKVGEVCSPLVYSTILRYSQIGV